MPFDATTFCPRVTVLPPTPIDPPERDGDPPRQRIHVQIEIVDRRGSQRAERRGYRFGTVTLCLLALAVLAALGGCGAADAQPRSSSDNGAFHYAPWQSTNGWHGETRQQGRTTDWNSYGPRGEQKHCHQYYVGDQPMTSCN